MFDSNGTERIRRLNGHCPQLVNSYFVVHATILTGEVDAICGAVAAVIDTNGSSKSHATQAAADLHQIIVMSAHLLGRGIQSKVGSQNDGSAAVLQ